MRISVVVCTRNRAEQLCHTLEAITRLDVPEGLSWEVIVVDNGSTDHTADIIDSFTHRLPIRRVWEETPGLSNARNRGTVEARGTYICWTDDDVLIDRGWLAAYAEAFARHPDGAFFGGPIVLVLEGPTPVWIKENRALVGPMLAERRFGDAPFELDPTVDRIPYGANYAVRAREQRRCPYDPNLGVSPTQQRLGEETTVLQTIHNAGGKGWWVPEARVQHIIPPDRQSLSYLAEYRRAAGETSAYLAEHGGAAQASRSMRLARLPFRGLPLLWLLRSVHQALFHATQRFAPSRIWLRHLLRSAFYEGAIAYDGSKQSDAKA